MIYRVSVWVNDQKLSLVQIAHTFNEKYITWAVPNHIGTSYLDVDTARKELKKYIDNTNLKIIKTEIRSYP